MAIAFIAIRKTIKFEGGYVNDPVDPGGETKYGISKRQFPNLDMKSLTIDKAFEIYKKLYWDEMRLDNCTSQIIANELFDTAVNMGVKRAARFLQEALNMLENSSLAVDGMLGPQTMNVLNIYLKAGNRSHLVESILLKTLDGLQFKHYWAIAENNPRMKRFLNGWINRRIGNERETE